MKNPLLKIDGPGGNTCIADGHGVMTLIMMRILVKMIQRFRKEDNGFDKNGLKPEVRRHSLVSAPPASASPLEGVGCHGQRAGSPECNTHILIQLIIHFTFIFFILISY